MHTPVLLKEVLEGLAIEPNDTVLDCTINGAGHSKEIVERLGKEGLLIGLDADASALETARKNIGSPLVRVELVQSNFRDLDLVLKKLNVEKVNKFLFDFGLSSNQLSSSRRGFSFERDEPLVMTFKDTPTENDLTASVFVNESSESALADIIFAYGGERYARRIAASIVEARAAKPIKTTSELVRVIENSVPNIYRKGRIHPATRTFQALRMAVNDELGSIKKGLRVAFDHLSSGGRIAAISFHSLEDKIVKEFARGEKMAGTGESITKKPITASDEEIKENPRSRSAKLRIIQKI